MAEQGKKPEKILSEEALRKGIQSMKGKHLPTDTEMFLGDLPKEMPDRFKKT